MLFFPPLPVDGKLVLVASHSVLAHRRYNPIVADLKCVLNIEGVPQRFLKACFTEWTKILVMVQVCGWDDAWVCL